MLIASSILVILFSDSVRIIFGTEVEPSPVYDEFFNRVSS